MIAEVIIFLRPTKLEETQGKLEEIVAGPDVVVAKDLENAKVQMSLQHFEVLKALDEERLEVRARPF